MSTAPKLPMSSPRGRNHVVTGAQILSPHQRSVSEAARLGYPDELAVAAALVTRLRSRDLGLYARVHIEADTEVLWLEASSAPDMELLLAHLAALPTSLPARTPR